MNKRQEGLSGPHRDAVVSSEVQQRVLEHAPMAGGEHEAVTVKPSRVLGVEAEELVEEDVAQRRAAHG